ncbi:hypothetical protein C8P68_101478 [Mucilaginibacter yixingensis]|uniref:PH (Pleckstrin Homology) domain-containing protein n=1 Tax=Mucilaginibacter yixingensis TaxID=1295612 RepID=A0A2T5JFS8_9SPHI|nr:hypothetical protein [Mucilaginibacter yixingensis]PTR01244.1 hypothetical protein C8P68_101478 [Mucilaginibacter yixingensis]
MQNIASYSITYSKPRKAFRSLALSVSLMIVPGINALKEDHPNYFYISFIIICLLIWIYISIELLASKTTFTINNDQLTVTDSLFNRHKTKIYELKQIEELEIENLKIKYWSNHVEVSKNKVLTFFYRDKEILLGSGLKNFNADELFNQINAAMIAPE